MAQPITGATADDSIRVLMLATVGLPELCGVPIGTDTYRISTTDDDWPLCLVSESVEDVEDEHIILCDADKGVG